MSNAYNTYDARLRSAWKTKLFDENGNEVADGDPIMRDGHRLAVPLMLLDSGKTVKEPPAPPFHHADRRPRDMPTTDEDRERRQKLYADADARVANAWRHPPCPGDEQ